MDGQGALRLPNENEIRAALGRLRKQPDFARSPRLAAFLDYIVTETLEGRGAALRAYTVATAVSGGDSPPGQSVVVSGEILNVFCDMYFSYTGQVSLLTKVTKAGKEVLTKHYAGEGSAGIAWGATEESYAQSLALALASALKQFVSDLEKSLMPQ